MVIYAKLSYFPMSDFGLFWIYCLEGFSDKLAAKIIFVAILSRSNYKMTGLLESLQVMTRFTLFRKADYKHGLPISPRQRFDLLNTFHCFVPDPHIRN